ncbi:MAG: Hint domain-containing protein [Planctomycetales bacterium]|nr:Hint domain-containing protein [Planctomycetales bacterium]
MPVESRTRRNSLRRKSLHCNSLRHDFVEQLESRICLASDCSLETSASTEAAAAVHAVNCFAVDLYEHMQNESGNIVLSPMSIATTLAMAYAGAAGDTAEEIADVLHLDPDSNTSASFHALLETLASDPVASKSYLLEVANAMWPSTMLPLVDSFVTTIQDEYLGEVQNLDYSDTGAAEETINAWVEEKTHGTIKELVKELSPATVMVLTNSIYFDAAWQFPFDPRWTEDGNFTRADGSAVTVPMMNATDGEIFDADTGAREPITLPYTELSDFQVLEMPFLDGDASMVFLMPISSETPNQLTHQFLAQVDQWLAGQREPIQVDVTLPRFNTTVSTQLERLLSEMGMPSAFGDADFSNMTPAAVWIDKVRHKAFLEVNEQGTVAGAATVVNFLLCFAAGTPVMTPDGEKSIEQLKVGDLVLSRHEGNVEGDIRPKQIEEVFQGHAEILNLHVAGNVLRVTKPHRFFVQGKGWVAAEEIRVGDRLATDGGFEKVDEITESDEVAPVFNFRVADYHTYFVGRKEWGFSVWTHNTYDGPSFIATRPFHFLIRDNTTSTLLFMGRIDDPSQLNNDVSPRIASIPGDSNHDGSFNSSDLVYVFAAGKYEDAIDQNASFEEGDWNGDGDFNSSDLVFAFQSGTYVATARPLLLNATSMTPEVSAAIDWLFAQDRKVGDGDFDQNMDAIDESIDALRAFVV